MGEIESLLLVVSLLYLAECLVWVRRGSLLTTVWFGKHGRLRYPGQVTGNYRGAILFAHPLPPLGIGYLSPFPQVSSSPDHLLAYNAACPASNSRPLQSGHILAWKEVADIETRIRVVCINGKPWFTALSESHALHIARWLEQIRSAPPAKRQAVIDRWLDELLDAENLKNRLQEGRQEIRRLRWPANLLFAFLFLALPPWLLQFGFGWVGLLALGVMLIQSACIAFLFRGAHKRCLPEEKEIRLKQFLTMLLAPPAAIRAPDLLVRHLVTTWHPLAVVHALCTPNRFRAFAREVATDLRHPLRPVCPVDHPDASFTEAWFRERTLAAVERFFTRVGLQACMAQPPVTPTDPAHRSHCPRCGAQFLVASGTCRDCGELPLVAFDSPVAERN